MFNLLTKLNFSLRKPRVVLVVGNGRQTTAEAIFRVLKPYFKIVVSQRDLPWIKERNEILVMAIDLEKSKFTKEANFLFKRSNLPILVATHVGDIPPDYDFFAGEREKTKEIRKAARGLPAQGYLILNFDDETIREIKDETNLKELTFGFQEEADFRATDVNLNGGTNFKINHQGNVVPVWLEKVFGKEQVYSTLAAAGVGTIFGLNLVEISQALKDYQSLPGKMKLIKGIKKTWILDNSESANVFSMIEAIEILGKLQSEGRKIAVLGDISGIGKYTIEAHEAIGEKVAKNAQILFTFGPKAKFIAQGAHDKSLSPEKIYQFDELEKGKLRLQKEIKPGDLILVDGSKEMEMGKVVKEIKGLVPIISALP